MKTKVLLFLLSTALLFSCNSCFKNSPPTIEITNDVPDSGWMFDTLKYKILLKSEVPPIRLQITPNEWSGYGDNIIDTIFEAKEVVFIYTYVLAFSEYQMFDIKFKVSQNDQQKDSIIRSVTYYTLGS